MKKTNTSKAKETGKAKVDTYQMVTDRIIAELESGVVPWHKPWSGISTGAYNVVRKVPYSFINQLMLRHSGAYASYNQWATLAKKQNPDKVKAKQWAGGVKGNEKGEKVVFWKPIPVKETDKDGNEVTKFIPFLKYDTVFHISQVEGVTLPEIPKEEHDPIPEAEKIISDYAARETITMEDVVGDRAYYSPSRDYLCVPAKEQYKALEEYYSTKFHAMIHSTGHVSRLDRFSGKNANAHFGSEVYSKEELIAEIGAANLMFSCGIETEKTFKNSAAYIQSWLNALKNDKKLIVTAAGKAEKAVKYILNGKTEKEDNDNEEE